MPKGNEEKWSYWRGMLRRQRGSGLSVRRFCVDEDLSYASFYRWKRKIAAKDSRRASNSEDDGKSRRVRADSGRNGRKHRRASGVAKSRTSTGAFIPVRVQAAGSSVLEVVHPRGHVVRVPAVFDAISLQQVLEVLDRLGGV